MTDSSTYTIDLSAEDDVMILMLWKHGYDTWQIATKLRRPEWQIANRLIHIRTKGAGNVISRNSP